MSLRHHELCFGCGRTNLFGLLLEAEREPDGVISGRCFIKQDHQGPQRGVAHPGVLATALVEALMLGAGESRVLHSFEVRFEPQARAEVGEFCTVTARLTDPRVTPAAGTAEAVTDGRLVARARARFRPSGPDAE
jgi:hypothetical protein